jgi:hypothetical protein
MFQEGSPVDVCRFEFLKCVTFERFLSVVLDPLKQLVPIPLFYLLDCGEAHGG